MAKTQKQSLKNLIEHLPSDFRFILISEWLEDINWHSEHSLLVEKYRFRNGDKMDWLYNMRFANDPASYSYEYVTKELKNIKPELLTQLADVKKGEKIIIGHDIISSSDLSNWQFATRNYQPFSYIYGWGIDNDGWNSKGTGEEFVNELLEIIEE